MKIWTDITSNWLGYLDNLTTRFPNLDEAELQTSPFACKDLAQVIALSHDLTPNEATEELEDWLYHQSLSRDAYAYSDMGSAVHAAE